MSVPGIEMLQLPLYMFGLVEGRKESGMSIFRDFNDWEIDDVATFFHLIQSKSPTHEEDDKFK